MENPDSKREKNITKKHFRCKCKKWIWHISAILKQVFSEYRGCPRLNKSKTKLKLKQIRHFLRFAKNECNMWEADYEDTSRCNMACPKNRFTGAINVRNNRNIERPVDKNKVHQWKRATVNTVTTIQKGEENNNVQVRRFITTRLYVRSQQNFGCAGQPCCAEKRHRKEKNRCQPCILQGWIDRQQRRRVKLL